MTMHSWRNWIAHQIPILAVTGSIPVECAKGQVGRLVFLYIFVFLYRKFLLIYGISWSKLKMQVEKLVNIFKEN